VNELATISEENALVGPDYYKPSALMDPNRFQHLATVARVMSDSSLMPDTLRGTDKNQAYANAFMVVNIADRWNLDPFLVAQAASVVHGKLMLEGKLVAAVLQKNMGVVLDYDYIRDAKDVITGIKVSGRRRADGKVVSIEGTIAAWATKSKDGSVLKQWQLPQAATQLIYRGTREWARVYEPGVMLGVLTDDEYDPAYSARDITPSAATAGAGQSVIERLRANKEQSKDGFDADRVNQDLNTAAPQRSGEEAPTGDGASTAEVEEGRISSTSESSAPEADTVEEGAAVEVGESSAPSSPDEKQWLLNVAGMLWAATNYNGDADVLKAQKVAAAASYDPTGISQPFRDKATSIFKHCMSVVAGEVEPSDGLSIVAGIVGVEDKVLLQKSGRA
jgi:hypothetical protein